MNIREVATEAAVISTSGKVTGAGGATGLVGFLTSMNWLGIGGFCIALGGLIVNIYFQVRRDRRETRESEARSKREALESQARLTALKDKCDLV